MADSGALVRTLAVAAVSVVVGLGLGGIAPRGEIRSLKAQVEELSDERCEGSGLGRQFAEAFRQRPWEPTRDEPERPASPAPVAEAPTPADDPVRFDIDLGDGENTQVDPRQVEESLQFARDAMAMRRRQAIAALEEGARPDPGQMDAIDAAIADMNTELLTMAQDFVGMVQGGEPSRRDAMIFAADTLDVLIEADDRIYQSLDADQRAAVDPEALDPMSHVDPALIDVFMELEGMGGQR